MLRAFFISLSKAGWARNLVSHWNFAWKAASRFVAGEKLEQAIAVVRQLNQRGIQATLDHLGENTESEQAAQQATQDILAALDAINQFGVRSNVSLKLSQLGLLLNQQLCRDNLFTILDKARALRNFVRIDMEDSGVVDRTLEIYYEARQQGFDNLGVVIQSYLYRSQADIEKLLEVEAKIRLVKGAYQEPAYLAYANKKDVDANFDRLTAMLLTGSMKAGQPAISADGRIPPMPAIATHDNQRIAFTQRLIREQEVPNGAVEFQMLYGIRRDLQDSLATAGFPVRIYIPYGTHWYAYFMRRLAERPANLWFFISNFFRR